MPSNVFYKKIVFQKALILILAFIAGISLITIWTRIELENKIQYFVSSIKTSNRISPAARHTCQSLLLLNQAENDFQLAVFTNNAEKLNEYKEKIEQAFHQIDSVVQHRDDSLWPDAPNNQKEYMRNLFAQKVLLSQKIFALRTSVDSMLLTAGKAVEENRNRKPVKIILPERYLTKPSDTSTKLAKGNDYVVKKRGGLLKRLKNAFAVKQDTVGQVTEQVVVNANPSVTEIKEITIKKVWNSLYQQSLINLQKQKDQMLKYQQQLFATSSSITQQLKSLITNLNDILEQINETKNSRIVDDYGIITGLSKLMSLVSILLVLLFSLLLIRYIKKNNLSENELIRQYDKAAVLAQQKTDLLATMSHEIRNPLNSIIGFLKALEDTGLTEKQTEMMDTIKVSSGMLLATINDALDFTKLDSGKFELQTEGFNPYVVTKSLFDTMQFSARNKNIESHYSFSGPEDLLVLGDAYRLKQILSNLISNAIKFTERGSVTVNANLKKVDDNAILAVAVIDTGIGIANAQLGNLFGKYYRASSSKNINGTGLGLCICKKLVHIQNGSLKVISEEGTGSIFSFEIPYKTLPDDPGDSIQINHNALTGKCAMNGKTLLAVDDDKMNLKLLELFASQLGVNLISATRAEQAINIFQETNIDIVITDMQMDKMDGKKLVEIIRQMESPKKDIPIILMSGTVFTKSEIEDLEKGGVSYILIKPFNRSALATAMAVILSDRTV